MVPGDSQSAGARHLKQIEYTQQRILPAPLAKQPAFRLRAIQRDIEQRLMRAVSN